MVYLFLWTALGTLLLRQWVCIKLCVCVWRIGCVEHGWSSYRSEPCNRKGAHCRWVEGHGGCLKPPGTPETLQDGPRYMGMSKFLAVPWYLLHCQHHPLLSLCPYKYLEWSQQPCLSKIFGTISVLDFFWEGDFWIFRYTVRRALLDRAWDFKKKYVCRMVSCWMKHRTIWFHHVQLPNSFPTCCFSTQKTIYKLACFQF